MFTTETMLNSILIRVRSWYTKLHYVFFYWLIFLIIHIPWIPLQFIHFILWMIFTVKSLTELEEGASFPEESDWILSEHKEEQDPFTGEPGASFPEEPDWILSEPVEDYQVFTTNEWYCAIWFTENATLSAHTGGCHFNVTSSAGFKMQ